MQVNRSRSEKMDKHEAGLKVTQVGWSVSRWARCVSADR